MQKFMQFMKLVENVCGWDQWLIILKTRVVYLPVKIYQQYYLKIILRVYHKSNECI